MIDLALMRLAKLELKRDIRIAIRSLRQGEKLFEKVKGEGEVLAEGDATIKPPV